MGNSLYQQFLKANTREIKESLELLANSEPNVEINVPSHIVGEVVWGLGYGNCRLDFDGTVKTQKYDNFNEVYGRLITTRFWEDLLNEGNRVLGSFSIGDRVSSELYGSFIARFARPIHKTVETLNDGLNVVDVDLAVVGVLEKMGYAKMLPYSMKGEAGFVKTESFDEFYKLFKQTIFYLDVEKNVGPKEEISTLS